MVKLLLQWNADINCEDNYSNTPLSDALKAGHIDLARFIHSTGGKFLYLSMICTFYFLLDESIAFGLGFTLHSPERSLYRLHFMTNDSYLGSVFLPKRDIVSTLCYQVYNEDHDLLEVCVIEADAMIFEIEPTSLRACIF